MLPEDSIKNRQKLKRAGKVVDTGSIPAAQLQEAIETNEKLDVLAEVMKEEKEERIVIEGIKLIKLKGEPGKPGEPGHTPTEEELLAIIEPLIPEVKNGDNYILTDEDKLEIAGKVKIPTVTKTIEKVKTIVEKPIVTQEIKEKAMYEDGETIFKKIKKYLTIESIERLDDILRSMAGSASEGVQNVGRAFNYLSNLVDVLITNPVDGQVLKYDGTLKRWVNGTASAGGANIAMQMVTAVQSGENVTIALTQLTNFATLATTLGVYYQGQLVDRTRWSIVGSTLTLTDAYTPNSFQVQYTYA
jgi:hypothetical protein